MLSVPLLSSLVVALWAGTMIWRMSGGGEGGRGDVGDVGDVGDGGDGGGGVNRNYRLPPFALTDQSGEAVTRATMEGTVWVADFVFTRCPYPCPLLTQRMSRLQSRLAGEAALAGVKLVSISVDPDHDTPPVLRGYGEKYAANFDRWSFLTGDRDEVRRLVYGGFRLWVSLPGDEEGGRGDIDAGAAAAATQGGDDGGRIVHSDRWVLVDRDGWVRGYYSGLTDDGHAANQVPGRDALLEDLRKVVAEE